MRPIQIVTAEPGGNTDVMTRMIAGALKLGQPIITQNRPSGVLAADAVLKSPPDGYTLLLQSASFWVGPLIQKLSYDPIRDFAAITLTHNAPFFLYVNPSVPAKSVKELIALAKSRPGELNYGSSAAGSSNHLAMELFNYMADVKIQRVPYKGAGPAGVGLVANQVQVMFGSAPFGLNHVKAGRLRVLGVANDERSPLAPDVPTISSDGLPGYESGGMAAIFAPAKTPRAVIRRLNAEIVRALNQPEIKGKLPGMGLELVASTAEQADAYIKAVIAKWGKLVQAAGIRQQ
jgi:tripartite-type tricarboxylate transporter receptor subunit TctC